jgi:hypothetical protein
MTESEVASTEVFWLFHEQDESELKELRKFMDPQIDTKPLEEIDKLLYQLRHLLD